eukprot:95465_1
MTTSKVDQPDENPYFKTYLRDHKPIKLPESFGKIDESSPKDPTLISTNRTDYKTLPKVKLFTINNILTPSDCDSLVRLTSDIGYGPIVFEYPEDYRKCERVICKSFDLASIIWNKILPYFTRHDIEDLRPYGFGNEGIWRPTHINEAIRFTRYRNGDFFKPHRDGGYTASNLSRSVYTIMIYLNDNRDFDGGDTVFYSLKKDKDSGDPSQADLFLNDNDISDAIEVSISPVQGMCVIFNHDVWHKGCQVQTANADKYKFILRSDIMFECYDCESFNRNTLMSDPLYIKAQKYYKLTVDLQNEGKVRESTISYLKALSIQTTLPSVIVDKESDQYYGEEYYWFTTDVYEYVFSFLDVYRLVTVCYVSRAWNYYGTSPTLWKNRYTKYFNINEIEHGSRAMYDNTAWLRPWKHIFSYRVMIKNEFPIIVLNMWMNGIEVGLSSKRKSDKNKQHYNHDQQLMMMDGNAGQYIPFATAEYKESNMWSWKPYRKEILYGRIIFTGSSARYGFRSPSWVINEYGILNGLLFHKLLKQILYFPNVVLSLPSIMYDNALFILYVKYMLTKFESQKYSKVFCVMIKNMEQEIAKYYRQQNCIIIVNEHRSFSISVIKNGQRITDNDKLMKKYIAIATETQKEDTSNDDYAARFRFEPSKPNLQRKYRKQYEKECFPNGYFHYRDDYDSSYYIANVSNFDFVGSVNDKTRSLTQNATEDEQRVEATPQLEPYRWSRDPFNHINPSSTAPQPVANASTSGDTRTVNYYQIGAKDEDLKCKLLNRLNSNPKYKDKDHMHDHLEERQCLNLQESLVNDIFVGPNRGSDIPQNEDFKYLTNRWDQSVLPQTKARDVQYYCEVGAPLANTLCYSAFDLVFAFQDLLKECVDCEVFESKEEKEDNAEESLGIPVIVVGPLTNFYGDFVHEFCELWNEEEKGFGVQFMKEYVQNEGTRNINDRSSALQHILQSVVTPKQISNFKSISQIKNEIIKNQMKEKEEKEKETDKNKIIDLD